MRTKKTSKQTGYDSAVRDEEWAFCAPYLTLMKEDAAQRAHASRRLFNAVRYLLRAGCPWRMIPNDLPPWHTVYQQAQRWIKAGCFEALAHDLRMLLRRLADRAEQPTAVMLDGRTMPSTPESGGRGGYDGDKRRTGSKVPVAVDPLGHLLALKVTAAKAQERAPVGDLVQAIQATTGDKVAVAFVDQGYTGKEPAAAAAPGINLEVVKLEAAQRGFVLLPRRWVVERSCAWAARFRRLAHDCERLPSSLAGLHWLALPQAFK